VALPADPAIEEKITAQERELAAVRQADQIKTRAALSPVTLPVPPAALTTLLAKTIEGIAADAERRVAAQIHVARSRRLSEALRRTRNVSIRPASARRQH
jgi:hypothetical protein